MLVFPNAKINLGLSVTGKRPDGFHNIETVFYPIRWCDALEVLESPDAGDFRLQTSGIPVAGKTEDNLLYRVWNRLRKCRKLPPITVHLHKAIPMGAGLGGGSSDAAFLISLLDRKFSLQLPENEKFELASEIGSDCPFFLSNRPLFAKGRGNELEPVKLNLGDYFIAVVHPPIHSNTAEAYQGVGPAIPEHPVKRVVEDLPPEEWKDLLVNDFEKTMFKKYPGIAALKAEMYSRGAVYASMSGSGSSVFGIFRERPSFQLPSAFRFHVSEPVQ